MKQSELIEFFLQSFPSEAKQGVIASAGQDDCAIVDFDGNFLLLSTDRTNSSPLAFELGIEDFRSLGRYIASANISDIIGSGGHPLGLLINISVPDQFDNYHLREIAEGIQEYTSEYDCPLIGGDMKNDRELILSGTGVGVADQWSQLRLQDGAEQGDWIIVSGYLGNCYASALAYSNLDQSKYSMEFVRESILDPGLPYDENEELRELGLGKGGIDISDGFGGDLMKLAGQSEVGLQIRSDLIPIHDEVRNIADKAGIDPVELVFGFGGDWEFIATVDQSCLNDIPDSVKVVGQVTDDSEYHLIKDGNKKKLPTFAYDDFDHSRFIDGIGE